VNDILIKKNPVIFFPI